MLNTGQKFYTVRSEPTWVLKFLVKVYRGKAWFRGATLSSNNSYYNTYPKIWTSPFYCKLIFLEFAKCVGNKVDPDQMPQHTLFAKHYLLRPVCPSSLGEYNNFENRAWRFQLDRLQLGGTQFEWNIKSLCSRKNMKKKNKQKKTNKIAQLFSSCVSYSMLTLILLNSNMPCLCKQCRSRSVGFWRSQLIWICTACH